MMFKNGLNIGKSGNTSIMEETIGDKEVKNDSCYERYAGHVLPISAFTSASYPPCSSMILPRYVKDFTSSKSSPSSVIRLLCVVLYRRILLFPLFMLRSTAAKAVANAKN
ncbi:unnamed protein product [Schistosoma mattheei]|uniref:Uncharacterized protein n=1 Tax=Schistosoma mattheei TaxID=31246 RepID=A0A183PNN7_9TREM|nr:unnamed protein product [Schistosoma mattheei]